jgi:transglutaminase-like putative cysteine protease
MDIAIDRGNLEVHWLPVPFGPTKVTVAGTWLWDARSQTVFSASRTTKNLPRYTVRASRPLPDRTALTLAAKEGVDSTVQAQYGKDAKVTPYVESLTSAITKGKKTAYDKAVAIQAYFTNRANGFVYDLRSSQPARGGDPLEAFLKGKHGFCEQYATAMAAMLRVADVPSRVAVGFTPGSREPKSTAFRVTTSDAHAWPEAWFAGSGWIRFEPTPAASGATVPSYTVAQAPSSGPAPTTPTAAPTPTASSKPAGGTDAKDLLDSGGGVPSTGGDQGGGGPSWWVGVPIVLGVGLVLPVLLTQLRRRRRWHVPGALTAWSQLRDDATDIGYRWHAADSPRAATARLVEGRTLGSAALASLHRITAAAEQARYAPPGRATGADLRPDVRAVRTALHESAPFWPRLQAVLFPRSTVQWAYHGLGERLADLLDAVDDVIAAVTRPIRRRAAPH